MSEKKKLTGREKFAYGIGAVGKDMVYMLSASYILYYYQDIMGVSAVAMGIILLAARVFDAFNDPIMGVLVAKTRSRWGRFRPWLFIGTLTNAVILILMFSAPPKLSGGGLVAYAAVLYILWGVTYTMMDIPYWSMVPAFTDGGRERENLSALARTCAGVGSAIVTIITVMAVSVLGNAMTAKNADNQTVQIRSEDAAIPVRLAELDDSSSPTGSYQDFDGVTVDLTVTASSEFFQEKAYCTWGNDTDYTLTIGDETYTKENLNLAIDHSANGENHVYLAGNNKVYQKLGESGITSISGKVKSTKEVERVGFGYFAGIIGILFFVFILITCLFIREKSSVDMETASVKDMFRALVQNDQAMAMVITIVLVNCATYITSNLLIYFFKYDLGGSNWQGSYTIFNTFAGGIQILAMMLFFPILRKFFNTIKIFYICIFSAVGGYVVLLIMALGGVGSVYPFLIPGFFIMAAVGMMNVLVTVFLANTVDYGELKNHRRDESVIFSMQTFVVKLASGIAALVASVCLQIFHISETGSGSGAQNFIGQLQALTGKAVQAAPGLGSVVGLRLTMTLVPIFVLLVSISVFRRKYILTDEKLEEISASLKRG